MHYRVRMLLGLFAASTLLACNVETPASAQPAASITQLVIEPSGLVSLPGDAEQQFTARAIWSDGVDRPANVSYETDGGVIQPSGRYRAPRLAGRYRVIARSAGTTLVADTTQVEVLPPTLTALTVAPQTASMGTGETLQLSASALWSDGTDSLPALSWSRVGTGSVSASGLYTTGSTAGTVRVIVAHVGGTNRDTATVTVVGATLSRLTISPKNVTLLTGASQQFGASALWSDGSAVTPAITWSRIGTSGSVTNTGWYTAPLAAGTYRVVVAHTGGTLRDTATVVVQAPPAPTVVGFTLTPGSVQLQRGASQSFTTAITWSDGATRTATVNYQVTGGTMLAGRYTAGLIPGAYLVIASCSCGAADTSGVLIQAPTLVSIAISPATVTLAPGAAQNFTVTVMWSDNTTTVPSVTFTTTGAGSIGAGTGAFVAPTTTGTYLVIAAPAGSALRDTAIVTVSSAPPPPPPSGSFTPNLPAGLSLVTDTEFGGLLNQQFNSSGLAYNWDGRNAVDPNAPFSTDVFEIFYPGGDLGNGTGGATLYGPDNQAWRRMYFSLMLWVPSNYSVHTNEEKFFYPLISTGSSVIFGWYVLSGQSPNGPTWSLGVDPQLGADRTYQNGSAVLRKGVYQRVEYFMQMNTNGQSNGIWQAWVDGVLATDHRNIRFSSGDGTFRGIRFEGVRGGGPSFVPTPTGGQVRRYTRLAFYASQN